MNLPPIGPPPIVLRADARNLPLEDSSVDLVVTSPPYFGLRSYTDGGKHYEEQIGAEATPAEFVDALIDVTRECMRVLKPSGSIWVNLGDKYASHGTTPIKRRSDDPESYAQTRGLRTRPVRDMPHKSLIGVPWRYALRCIDDLGLILRAEVIWAKKNGLPESCTDRVTRKHEQWFHFVQQPQYYSAVDEVRLPQVELVQSVRGRHGAGKHSKMGSRPDQGEDREFDSNPLGKLPPSVWEFDDDGESLERSVLLATLSGSLTIDEAERVLQGIRWTGSNGSGGRSTSPGTAGSGQPDAHPRGMASSGSTERPSSRTESPTPSPQEQHPTSSTSTTCVESGTASGTSSPSQSAKTSCADPRPSQPSTRPRPTAPTGTSTPTPTPTGPATEAACAAPACETATEPVTGGLGVGSVWWVATEPFRAPAYLGTDHFAAYPVALPERIISGWSPRGVCVECGEGRRPVAEHVITGYACDCPEPAAPTTPARVLDPFGGTGTTAHVAHALGRQGISVDLSHDYCRIARDPDVRGQRVAKVRGIKREKRVEIEGQEDLFGGAA